ncbi:MAG: hypothetical protein KDB65_09955 [Calditrichaeota bacterium]|nr:hypothetical protein [Calditrichota bacterium]MCB9369516.1 hypothetical protein [Calditrichota bacterium]
MTNTPEQPLISAQNLLSDPTNLDLDKLSGHLSIAAVEADALRALISLYEDELRRELRAKVDLAGPIPACPDPELAFTMSGEQLLAARRQASLHFNRVFQLAPVSRSAIPANKSRVPQDLLLRSGLGTN